MALYNINTILNNVLMSQDVKFDKDILINKISKEKYSTSTDKYNIFTQLDLNNTTINFGFKIHISATLENYQEILDIVANYLIKNKITFKYISAKKYLKYILSDTANRSSAGKFITIYPNTTTEFIITVKDLYQLLKDFKGQHILTDRRYKNSIVQYRFGSFVNNNKIILDNGEIFFDDRAPIYKLPSSIKDPFENEIIVNNYIGVKYKVFKVIQQKVSGGIYLAKNSYGETFILKEARPNVRSINGKDVIYYKMKERDFLQENKHKNFPNFIEDFFDGGHYFLVEQYIKSYTLSYFKSLNVFNIENAKTIINNILKMVKYFHDNGYFIMDISDKNIMIDDNLNVYFIDLENVTRISDDFKNIDMYRTQGFYNSEIENLDWKKQDYQQLGYLFLSLFCKANIILNIDNTGEYTHNYFFKTRESRNIPNDIVNLIFDLIFTKYDYIDDYYLDNKNLLYNFSEKNHTLDDLKNTTEKYLKTNNIYSSYPDYVTKSPNLYGESGIKKVINDNIYNFEDILISNNDFPYDEKYLKKLINDNNYSLENGIPNMYMNLLILNDNNSLVKILEDSLVTYLKNIKFQKGDTTGLFNGYLSVLYALSFNSELIKRADITLLITKFINKFKNVCINSSSFKNTQLITIGEKSYSSYVSNGISGFLKTLIKINKILDIDAFKHLIKSITDDLANVKYTQNATYATGMSGIIDTLIDVYEYLPSRELFDTIATRINELENYIINYNDDFFIPSQRLINLGLDYSGGNSGVISVYERFNNLRTKG